jgi:hypothetical protein
MGRRASVPQQNFGHGASIGIQVESLAGGAGRRDGWIGNELAGRPGARVWGGMEEIESLGLAFRAFLRSAEAVRAPPRARPLSASSPFDDRFHLHAC